MLFLTSQEVFLFPPERREKVFAVLKMFERNRYGFSLPVFLISIQTSSRQVDELTDDQQGSSSDAAEGVHA